MQKFLWLGALSLTVWAAGCGRPPQIARPNQKLIDGLRTATSSRQLPWIDECAGLLEERKRQQQITAAESTALEEVIALARAGKWKEAEARSILLQKAQHLADAPEK